MSAASPPGYRLLDVPGGCELSVRAQPGARRCGVAGIWNGQLKVALRAAPVDGQANAELLECLAELCELSGRAVQLVAGATARHKRVFLAAPSARVRAQIDAVLETLDGKR